MGLLYTIQIGLIVLWNYSEHKWFRKYLLKFHTWPVAQLITDDLDTLFCFILGQFGMENRIFLKCSIHDKFYWGNIIDINSVLKYFATHDSIIFRNKSVMIWAQNRYWQRCTFLGLFLLGLDPKMSTWRLWCKNCLQRQTRDIFSNLRLLQEVIFSSHPI